MEDSRIGGSDYFDLRADILSVEHNILAAPSYDLLLVEAPDLQEVRAVLTRHPVTKVPPESRVP